MKGFQRKYDLVTDRPTYLRTDKVIHRGAPLLKISVKSTIPTV